MYGNDLRGRHFLTTEDWKLEELERLLEVASDLKNKFSSQIPHRYLADKTIFLLFFDVSTRTRNSFEAGITQLGGHAHYIDVTGSQVAHGDSPKDLSVILSSYGHGIAVRHDLVPGEGRAFMRELARNARVPVLNMQCDFDHPCQTVADLMTLRETFGTDLRGLKVAVCWAYASAYQKPLSVPQGLAMLLPRVGVDVVVAHPPGFELMPEAVDRAHANARKRNATFAVVSSMDEACQGAQVVYAKSWGSLPLMANPGEGQVLAKKYEEWCCDEALMGHAGEGARYMHCLPAERGKEVTESVMDGPRSLVYEQAENRLHTSKALMALTM